MQVHSSVCHMAAGEQILTFASQVPPTCFFTYKMWTVLNLILIIKFHQCSGTIFRQKKKKKRPSVILCFSQKWSHPLHFSGTVVLFFFIPRQCFYFINVYTFGKKLPVVHSSAHGAKLGYLLCKSLPYWEQILDVSVRKSGRHCFLPSWIII